MASKEALEKAFKKGGADKKAGQKYDPGAKDEDIRRRYTDGWNQEVQNQRMRDRPRGA